MDLIIRIYQNMGGRIMGAICCKMGFQIKRQIDYIIIIIYLMSDKGVKKGRPAKTGDKSKPGRPKKNEREPTVIHAEREQSEIVYQMWTQHKRVLIASELQFVYELADEEQKQALEVSQKAPGSKKIAEKFKKKYQSGFLYKQKNGDFEQASAFKKEECNKFPSLKALLESNNEDQKKRDLRDMIQASLEIKHQDYRKQFIPIYEIICKNVEKQIDQKLIKEDYRNEWKDNILKQLMDMIKENKEFPEFNKLINKGKINFQNFLKTEAYCLLAQYFNFRINEYYCEAFQYVEDDKTSKHPNNNNEDD